MVNIFAWMSLAKYFFIPLKGNQPKQMKSKNQSIVMVSILKSISTSMQESGSTMTKQVLWVDVVVYFRSILSIFLPKLFKIGFGFSQLNNFSNSLQYFHGSGGLLYE